MSNDSKNNENSLGGRLQSSTLFRFIEFSSVVGMITASLYFVSYGYYDSFFGSLSLPHMGLNLPSIFYFQDMWRVWLLGLIFISVSFIGVKEPPVTIAQVIIGNLVPILIALGGIIWCLPKIFDINYSYIASFGFISLLFSLFFLTVDSSKKKWSLAYFFYSSGLIVRLILIAVFIFFMFWIAGIMGSFDAQRLVAGDLPGSQIITLDLKELNNNIQNKSFILVLHYNNEYYMVEKNIPVPEYPLMYIIPDDQVKMAIIQRIQ